MKIYFYQNFFFSLVILLHDIYEGFSTPAPCYTFACSAACCIGLTSNDCYSHWAMATIRCPISAPICHLVDNTCGKCEDWGGDSACYGSLTCDSVSGQCKGCIDDSGCPPTTICIEGFCMVGCKDNSGCTSPEPFCNPVTHRCMSCNSTNCPATLPVCDAGNGICGPCSTSTNSPCDPDSTTPLCSNTGECVACNSGDNSPCYGLKPYCDTNGSCSKCFKSNMAPCSGVTPLCMPTGECVSCDLVTRSPCNGTTPRCRVTGVCEKCDMTTNAPCSTSSVEPQCLPSGACGTCSTQADCASIGKTCNTNNGKCESCVTAGCDVSSTTPRCDTDTGLCMPCSGDLVAPCLANLKPKCTVSGACDYCDSTTCSGTTPKCGTFGNCVPCDTSDNSPCAASGTICQSSGVCALCDATSCPSTAPVCTPTGCTNCVAGGGCSTVPGRPYCNTMNGQCESCSTTGCSGLTPKCHTNGTCVACTDSNSDHCKNTNPLCLPTGACGPCTASEPCQGNTPRCALDSGACGTCDIVNHSPCSGTTPECLATGGCSPCTANRTLPCSGNKPLCKSDGTCAACSLITNAPCESTLPRCMASGDCNACDLATNSPCSGTTPLCLATGECGPCTASAPCTGSKPFCNPSTGACESCAEQGCTDPTKPTCNLTTGKCEACTPSSCSSPTPICDSGGECLSCQQKGCDVPTPYCNTTSGFCVACNNNLAICPSTFPYCNTDTGKCRNCTEIVCNGYCDPVVGRCLACVSDLNCGEPKPYCNTTNGSCLSCTNTGCSAPSPICNPASGFCQSCNATGCSDFPGKPYCRNSTGDCVSCQVSGCKSPKPFCDAVSGYCRHCNETGCKAPFPHCFPDSGWCESCTISASFCQPPNPYCNSTSGLCQNCTERGCQSGYWCNRTSGYCESCSVTGCQPLDNHCNFTSGICTSACFVTSDCANNYTCGQNNTCVECIHDSNCSKSLVGKNCIQNKCQPCHGSGDCSDNRPCIAGICGECQTSVDCMNATRPICSTISFTCRACLNDTECSTPNFCDKESGKCDFCSIGNCITCKTVGECKQCRNGYTLANGQCVKNSLTPNLEITQLKSDPNQFLFTFDQDIVTTAKEFSDQISIEFSKPGGEMNVTVVKQDNRTFLLEFIHEKTIESQSIYFSFQDAGVIQTRDGVPISKKQFSLEIKALVSTTLVRDVKTFESLITNPGVVTGGLFFVSMNPSLLWMLIGLIQNFYYLLFINTRFPFNIEMLLSLFSIARLDFLPNIFLSLNLGTNYDLKTPQRFEDQGFGGLFLIYGGPLLTFLVFGWIFYYFSHYFWKFTRNVPRLIMMPIIYYVNSFKWELAIQLLKSFYMQLCLSAVLQISVMDDQFWIQVISAYVAIAVFFLCFFLPFALIKIVSQLKKGYKPNAKIFKPLVKNLKNEYSYGHHIIAIELLKRFVTANSLVIFYVNPLLQILFYAIANFGYLIFYLKFRPKKSMFENILDLFSQINYMVVLVLVTVLISEDGDPDRDDKILIGWVVIGLSFGDIVFVTLANVIRNAPSNFKSIIKWLRKNPAEIKGKRSMRRKRTTKKV